MNRDYTAHKAQRTGEQGNWCWWYPTDWIIVMNINKNTNGEHGMNAKWN